MKQYCIKIIITKEYNKVVKLTLTFLFWSGFSHILGGLMSGGGFCWVGFCRASFANLGS